VSVDTGRLIIKCLLMTKLAILLIIVQSFQSFANNGYGQGNISLRLEKTQLKKVFKAIEEGGFYRFVYKDDILPKEQSISIRVQHAELADVMAKVLENTGLTYHKLSDNLVVITRADGGEIARTLQAVRISGKVTSVLGEPLKGVSVVEKSTNNGTTTGEDGTYTLQVTSPNATLVFSYVGFGTKELALKGKTAGDIQLQAIDNSLNAPAFLQIDDGVAGGHKNVARAHDIGTPEKDNAVAIGVRRRGMNDFNAFLIGIQFLRAG